MKNLVYHDPNVTVKVLKSKNGEARFAFSLRSGNAESLMAAARALAQFCGMEAEPA